MSGLQSIYRKDYLWPVRKLYFPRTDLRCSVAAPVSPKQQNDPRQADKDQSACTSEEAPSPKLGACPKTETLEFSEIDACLKKMFRENPNMFSVMKKRSSTDALRQFNAERLKSTYQVDFDHMEDQAQIDERQAACPNDTTDQIPPICRPQTRSRAELMKRRRGGNSEPQPDPCSEKAKSKTKKKKRFDESDEPDFMLRVLPAWSSEYRDMINKTGGEIMREMKMSPRKRAARLRRKRLFEIPQCEDKMTLG